MERTVYHVVPHLLDSNHEWRVVLEGHDKASGSFEYKEEAIECATRLAEESGLGQIIIHNMDGTIEEERTYGEDPERFPG